MPKKITKEQAIAQGLKQYYTGELCKNGHKSTRFTRNGACVVCNREMRKLQETKKRLARKRDKLLSGEAFMGKDLLEKIETTPLTEREIAKETRSKIYLAIYEDALDVVVKVLEQAKNGCTKSQGMVLDRLLPKAEQVANNQQRQLPTVNINISSSHPTPEGIVIDVQEDKDE